MILEILSIGLIVSACLALFQDEVHYAVGALAGTFLFISLIYALNGAIYGAVFQFAVGIGTLTVLFLSGEMLSEKTKNKTSPKKIAALITGGTVLSLPAIFIPITGTPTETSATALGEALWELRGMDIILQSIIVLTISLGIFIVLHGRKKKRGAN
ncbi:MAG: NADH-quinone oxidoreductase subunit J [Candidatus Bathyarchaeota archaeon]|nr:NADH-quinone oxidoreductase subunit J [Candidatus Termiticorpusculum sp.]